MAPKIDYSLRLPDGEFFPAARKKSGIAIHHTVGGTAFSTFDYWLKDRTKAGNRRMVGTAFLIDRDGTVYQVFDPTAWAFQFGVKWQPARQMKFEQRFIGIELASEGGLTEFNGKLHCFDRISPKTVKPRTEAFDYLDHYRGYRYFDRYESVQVDRLVQLINYLCDTYSIARQLPYPPIDYYGERLFDFRGIIGHAMVRRDKSDPAPDVTLWDRLIKDCKLAVVSIPKAPQPQAIHLSDQEMDRVFEGNMRLIGKMAVGAGSMVKGLIMELERRDTYIRLHSVETGGHKVRYHLLVGKEGLVKRLAAALGLQHVTPSTLLVPNG
ncbi:N-acetylmuramoyl-L-alanine amidase [Gemmatimonadota bacterium]